MTDEQTKIFVTPNEKTGEAVTARDIKIALGKCHTSRNDLWFDEVKTGPSWGTIRRPGLREELQGMRIIDFWAMRRSWTRPCITAYEIKISRSDFKADNKWEAYLPLCDKFYFACPKDMIKPEEIPDGIGLVYFNPKTGKIRKVKEAKHRNVEVDLPTLEYILMWRVRPIIRFRQEINAKGEESELRTV